MKLQAERFAHRLEQPVVAEPTVGHHQHRRTGKAGGDLDDHGGRLRQLGLKRHHFAAFFDVECFRFYGLLRQVEPKRQRQAGPAALDELQQPHGHHVLRPGILRLVRLGGMIEDRFATEDLAPHLRIDEVIEHHHHAPITMPSTTASVSW